MDFVTIFVLLIPLISLYVRVPAETVAGDEAVRYLLLTVATSAVYLRLGMSLFGRYAARRMRLAVQSASDILLQTGKANNIFVYGLALLFFTQVHFLKLKESFECLCFSSELFFLSDLLLLMPFLGPFIVFRAWTGRQALLVRGTRMPLRREIHRQLRTTGVLLLPQLLYLNLYRTLISDIPGLSEHLDRHPIFAFALAGVLLFVLFALSPFFIRLLFQRVPLDQMPQGEELAAPLQELARRSGIALDRIFVWMTRERRIANAAVSGLFRRQRTVFLTDHLLATLSAPEVTAVVAHEIGHASFKHLFFNFLLAILSGVFVVWGLVAAGPYLSSQEDLGMAVIALEVVYILGIFGLFARRFERQADLYAAHVTGSPRLVAEALLKLARANHMSVARATLTHPSIRSRVGQLQQLVDRHGADLSRVVGRTRLVNILMALTIFGLLAATGLALEHLPL